MWPHVGLKLTTFVVVHIFCCCSQIFPFLFCVFFLRLHDKNLQFLFALKDSWKRQECSSRTWSFSAHKYGAFLSNSISTLNVQRIFALFSFVLASFSLFFFRHNWTNGQQIRLNSLGELMASEILTEALLASLFLLQNGKEKELLWEEENFSHCFLFENEKSQTWPWPFVIAQAKIKKEKRRRRERKQRKNKREMKSLGTKRRYFNTDCFRGREEGGGAF